MGAWIETIFNRQMQFDDLVAPHVGAWIETSLYLASVNVILSLPTWERGLKHRYMRSFQTSYLVAPHVGAWIETGKNPCSEMRRGGRAPRWRGALPTWERGLKHDYDLVHNHLTVSLPTWERGLKHRLKSVPLKRFSSLPTWERGLKHIHHPGIGIKIETLPTW